MKKINKIGVQLYTIRDFIKTEEDIKESFKKLKDLGYDEVEMVASDIPYEIWGEIAQKEGLTIVSSHENFEMVYNDFDKMYEKFCHLGTKIMGISWFYPTNFSECEEFVRKAKYVAAKLADKGGKFLYHNHSQEFLRLENGQLLMDYLIENLSSDAVTFELDTHWLQRAGCDVCSWIEKVSGKIDILHLKDFYLEIKESYCLEPLITEIGNGNLDWDKIIDTAIKAGTKHFIVEQDTCPGNPFDSLKISSDYLHKNFM